MRYVTRRLPLGQYRAHGAPAGEALGRSSAAILRQTVDVMPILSLK
jgi:hypothetical protein